MDYNIKEYLEQERDFYKSQLLDNILAFWLKYGRDMEYGGYNTCLGRDGSVYDYDKICTWGQGRIIWVFGHLYNNYLKVGEWLDMARHGVDFMMKFGFDESGHIYYSLTREGLPLMKCCDIFGDLSFAAGLAEYAKAADDAGLLETAKKLVFNAADLVAQPEKSEFRTYLSQTRPVSLNAEYMILLNTVQTFRELDNDARYDGIAKMCMEKIFSLHYSEKHEVAFEAAGTDGGTLPGGMGRWVCPGHMIELGWFLIHEGQYRGDKELIEKALNLISWGMKRGWDKEYGGIVNDVDIEDKPLLTPVLYYGSLKMWWSGAEALYANLLSYSVTGDMKFLEDYKRVREWSFKHFADEVYGDWYGYLSPEGNPVDRMAKGTGEKNCYHIGRSFYYCYRLLNKITEAS